jgi:hypothetical protein
MRPQAVPLEADASAREGIPRPLVRRVATITVMAAVAIFYLWCARSADGSFVWNADLGGYYDLLSRGFLNGHLYMPIEPNPALFRLADPWDPDQNKPYRLHDAVLYHRHYYLYHGVVPALMLFVPWRFATGHDLPESFAAFIFSLSGFLFSCLLFIGLLKDSRLRPPIMLFAALLLALGVAQGIPYLLQRVLLYEVAIASGYCFFMGGCYFFFRQLTAKSKSGIYTVFSGLCFGLTVGCRPDLIAGSFLALAWLLFGAIRRRGWRGILAPRVIAFVTPFALVGIALAFYNYLRFGNPFEFGVRYQLGDLRHPDGHLSLANLMPGLYYLIACPPDFSRVFPFFRLAIRLPFRIPDYVLSPGYLLEPIAGFLTVSPLALLAFASPLAVQWRVKQGAARTMVWLLFSAAIACLLLLAGTGWATQRYEVDFLALILLAGCYTAVAACVRMNNLGRRAAVVVISLLVLYSVAASLALAIQGPYDSFVQIRPHSYVRIAHWFPATSDSRLLLNPEVAAEATVQFPDSLTASPEPLITAGEFGSRYVLQAQRVGGYMVRLTSATAPTSDNVRTADVTLAPGLNRAAVEFLPRSRLMMVRWNDRIVLEHELPFLVTAPSQLKFGEDSLFGRRSRFSGHIGSVLRRIEPGR